MKQRILTTLENFIPTILLFCIVVAIGFGVAAVLHGDKITIKNPTQIKTDSLTKKDTIK